MLQVDAENLAFENLGKIQNFYLEFRKQLAEFFHMIPNIVFDVNTFNMICETKGDDNVKFFYKNGLLKSEWCLNNGALNGVTKNYYKSGRLQAEWSFEDGILNGTSKIYYESGKLLGELNYKNGKPDGIIKKYHENGEYAHIKTYSNGELINKRVYDSKGKLEFQEDYQPVIGNREDDTE
jgi:antitoxin component YwqK of YwqJK toxin-antitoxin module